MCMSLGVHSPSSADRGWLVRFLLAQTRRREKGLRQDNSQSYSILSISCGRLFTACSTHPPSRRPYELAGDTMQSNWSYGGVRAERFDWMIVNLAWMSLGRCFFNASCHSSMSGAEMSKRTNSRWSMDERSDKSNYY